MFANIFKDMDPFYQNISSFPTALFSVLLIVCVVYWAGTAVGLFDIDVLDFDTDIDINADSEHSTANVLSGLLMKLKAVGVPVVITLTSIILLGWLICYYLAHFFLGVFLGNVHSGILRFVLGIPVFAVSLIAAAWLTTFLMKPLRGVFNRSTEQAHKHILGQRAVVRTSRVDENFGEATLDDGGAGLILKIRSDGEDVFTKGDRVVIFERLNDDNVYRVISEKEFSGV